MDGSSSKRWIEMTDVKRKRRHQSDDDSIFQRCIRTIPEICNLTNVVITDLAVDVLLNVINAHIITISTNLMFSHATLGEAYGLYNFDLHIVFTYIKEQKIVRHMRLPH